ncbi:4Fe-4S binding protein [Caldicellulosiruptoraceae bacterium PP1]
MRKAKLDKNVCDSSPFCPAARSCKFGAFKIERQGFFNVKIDIDESKCTGCGVCTAYCPHGAVSMKEEK